MIIRKKKPVPVQPSSRDSISTWLDVLVSMVSLPPAQRDQIRDELEDHLRSRVDDLLISGVDEHDAVRQAVGELGETAELAKVVTLAHTRTTPRRRIMQTTLLATAIAGMSFGGYTMLNATSSQGLPSAVPAVIEMETEAVSAVTTDPRPITEVYSLSWADGYMIEEIGSTLHEMMGYNNLYKDIAVRAVGAALVVHAMPDAHKEIDVLLREIEKVNEMASHEARALHGERIERIRVEFDIVRTQLIKLQREYSDVDSRRSAIEYKSMTSEDKNERTELRSEVDAFNRLLKELDFARDEMVSRYEYLRVRLIETEYEELLSDSSSHRRANTQLTKRGPERSSADRTNRDPADETNLVYITGEGLRSGAYDLKEGLELRQLLIASGYDFGGVLGTDRQKLIDSGVLAPKNARVSLSRSGAVSRSWNIEDLLSDDAMSVRLRPGDEIILKTGG